MSFLDFLKQGDKEVGLSRDLETGHSINQYRIPPHSMGVFLVALVCAVFEANLIYLQRLTAWNHKGIQPCTGSRCIDDEKTCENDRCTPRLLLVTGCLGGVGRPKERGTGKMLVSASIPEVLRAQRVSSQSVLEDVTLQYIVVTVTRGASTEIQQVEVRATASTVEASFANLSPGTWHVQVQAVDDEDYVIAEGAGSANVSPGAVTDVVVNLHVRPGMLTLSLMVPDDTSVTSGRISLLVGGAEEEFPATGNETTIVEMGQVMAQVWLIEVELQNASGGWVFRGHGQVAVLLGRDTNATIVFDEEAPGGLRVTVSWSLPPEKPTNVQASYAGGAVRLS